MLVLCLIGRLILFYEAFSYLGEGALFFVHCQVLVRCSAISTMALMFASPRLVCLFHVTVILIDY
jgi:hypothetical protein